jgi:hypothetical protein
MAERDPASKDAPAGPYRGPERAAPYALSRLAGPVSLVDVAREIEQADAFLASTTHAQLSLIADQMAALRAEAERVMARARSNAELHRAEARFVRTPGKVYHLYERDGSLSGPSAEATSPVRYWSMLSPEDWGASPPHRFLGSFRLEPDQSWTPLERQGEIDARRELLAEWMLPVRLPSGR